MAGKPRFFSITLRHFFAALMVAFCIFTAITQGEAKESQKDAMREIGNSNGSGAGLTHVVLRLAWLHQFQFAGYYAAVEKGFYRDAGFKVTIVEGKPERGSVEEVISGRANYGVARSELLLHRLHGRPVVALAVIFQHSAVILLAKKESGIDNPHEMIGKRVMLLKGDDSAEHIAMFQNEGVSLEQIKVIPSTFNIDDLIDGKTDVFNAYITNEPYYLERKGIPVSIISPKTYGIDFYGDCLFTSEQEIKDHPDRVRIFREASLRGWKYAMAHPEEIIDVILTKYSVKKTRDHLRFEANAIRKLMLPDLVEIGHMNPGRWHHIAGTYVELGMADPDYSLKDFIYDPNPRPDNTWIRWAFGVAVSLGLLIGLSSILLLFHNKRLQVEIKQRKDAEESLRLVQFSINNAKDALYWVGPDAKFAHVNDAACKMLGYKREELLTMSVYDIDPEIPADFWPAHWDDIRNRGSFVLETTHLRKEGTIFPVEISVNYIRFGDHEYTCSFARDITDRKLVEEALQQSEEKYRAMMEAMKNAAYICSPEFRIRYMNPAMINRIGHDATGEMCYKAIYDRNEKCSWCVFDQVQKEKHIEYEMAGPKDNRYYSVTSSPISHSDGTVSKLTIFHDITEIKNMEAQLQQARKMESIGTLTGGIAHDFNNILGIIIGNTELALEDVPKWNPAHFNLEEIRNAGLRAANIVRQLLSFSRKTGQGIKPIEIVPVIKESLNFLRSTIPTTIDIRQDIQVTDESILADPVQINQVLINICTNAFQAMEETGGILELTVETTIIEKGGVKNYPDLAPGEYVKIAISDTGPGIDPEIMDRIFDPYFTTKEVGKGSGMGLAVVHGIIKNHAGAITVDSQRGKGAIFTMLFPVVTEKPVMEVKTPDEIPHGNETILLVDDEERIVNMTQKILERLGYTVETKINPIEALELFRLKAAKFDLVITDMTMPQMTGVKLSEKLMEIRKDIPVIVCTGHSSLINEEKAKELGIAAYVMKPIVKQDIAKTIRKVLDNQES